MIQRTAASVEARHASDSGLNWQQALATAINRPETLLAELGLSPSLLTGAQDGHRLFNIRVPRPYLDRITPGDPNDPLLRQVLPLEQESETPAGYITDPLQEANHTPQQGLIRKYRSRALLMVTGTCAINCRYCFRRHFPYGEHRMSPDGREQALDTLRNSPEINEVIFSGGDPLAVNDQLLAQWVSAIEAIPHIRRLRIHSRLPVVIPQRVDDQLITWLGGSRLQKVVVLHINHAREIDDAVKQAAQRLQAAGATLLNQSVILRGVNDSAGTLADLSEALFDADILPYYLHAFDPVAGAAHFDVPDDEARAIVAELTAQLPGFLVPKLVREIPGKPSKTPLNF
ncbi:EF-P beta-lysylation protein EpmB [Marinobacter sp. BGYM27]|uniref:EF-P beta-lysylation protein EpmB n=1 Tax=Marinobacter sp. BGYM27 TaxID=2975597 RepID=UPI0021A82158|nr:EF-P beta-lysylation protein EpmB [Marinobacter sp. BGYM27]MDG5499328.1 EF-P beta-lysylation protein EpmB [Marinobacter sp. BGYM27]